MKDLIIVLLLLILTFLVWNNRVVGAAEFYEQEIANGPSTEPVSPAVTQVILEKVQEGHPDMVPLETLFINHEGDGVYKSRFMFFNSRKFYGTQMDVQAHVGTGGVVKIIKQSETARENYSGGYKPDKYNAYEAISNTLDAQLRAASRPQTSL